MDYYTSNKNKKYENMRFSNLGVAYLELLEDRKYSKMSTFSLLLSAQH